MYLEGGQKEFPSGQDRTPGTAQLGSGAAAETIEAFS